jgi:hypothetical protein
MENDFSKMLFYVATGGLLVYFYMKSKEKQIVFVDNEELDNLNTWQNSNYPYYLYPYPYYGNQSQPIVVNTNAAAAASSTGNATAEAGKPSAPVESAPVAPPAESASVSFAGKTSTFFSSEKLPPYAFDGIINKSIWH